MRQNLVEQEREPEERRQRGEGRLDQRGIAQDRQRPLELAAQQQPERDQHHEGGDRVPLSPDGGEEDGRRVEQEERGGQQAGARPAEPATKEVEHGADADVGERGDQLQ
jgi:hypothetical protein